MIKYLFRKNKILFFLIAVSLLTANIFCYAENVGATDTVEASDEIVEIADTVEASEENVVASEDIVGASSASPSDEDVVESNDEIVEAADTVEASEENVGASSASPTEEDVVESSDEIVEAADTVGASISSPFNKLSDPTDLIFGLLATRSETTIYLLEDATLTDTIIIDEDITFDLNGHTITAADNGHIFDIIDSDFVLTNSKYKKNLKLINSFDIDSNSFDSPAIKIKNGNLTLLNVSIKSNNGMDSVHLIDSNINIENSKITAGTGLNSTFEKGMNGGKAIKANFSNRDFTISIIDSIIKGGNGGSGFEDSDEYFKSLKGKGLTIGLLSYTNDYFLDGSNGDKGCGNGGTAIYIDNENYDIDSIKIENSIIKGGSGGFKRNESLMRNKLYKNNLQSNGTYYDSRKENIVTAQKRQIGETCQIFTAVASAETYLLKYFNDYVVNDLGYTNPKDLSLSEKHLAYYMRYHVSDPLNNAQSSGDDFLNSLNYYTSTTTKGLMFNALANWRGVADENFAAVIDEDWDNVSSLEADNRKKGLTINAKAVDIESKNLPDSSSLTDTIKSNILNDAKNKIKNFGGITILTNLGNVDDTRVSYSMDNIATYNDDIKNAVTYVYNKTGDNNFNVLCFDGQNIKGHAMFVVGFDDNFPAVLYGGISNVAGTHDNGAFIVKQTWGDGYDYVPYEQFLNRIFTYYATTWKTSGYDLENLYYYDGGNSPVYMYPVDSAEMLQNRYFDRVITTFKSKQNEKLKAISYVSDSDTNVDIKVFKVPTDLYEDYDNSDEDKTNFRNYISNDNNAIININNYNLHDGLNFIEIDEKNQKEFLQNECFAIAICYKNSDYGLALDSNNYASAGNYRCNTTLVTEPQNLYRLNDGSFVRINYNLRIKAITNSTTKKIIANAKEGKFEDASTEKIYNYYLADKVVLKNIETPKYDGYVFNKWVDANGNPFTSDYITIGKDDINIFATWSKKTKPSSGGSSSGGGDSKADATNGPLGNLLKNENVLNTETVYYLNNDILIFTNTNLTGLFAFPTSWNKIENKWKLNADVFGNSFEVKNMWYTESIIDLSNGFLNEGRYLFDENGFMITSWVCYNGNWYYMNTDNNENLGKMCLGWRFIQGKWYYFDKYTGIMLKNTITPDGFYVNENGESVSQ